MATARERRQMSQWELAASLNAKQLAVAKLGSGDNNPRVTTMHSMASTLGAEITINAAGVKVRLPRRRTAENAG